MAAARRIEAWQGQITTLDVDAIVNAANSGLRPGGGVCGAIFAAAGHADLEKACTALGGCATGDAKATPGFRLPARWVIHAVGPVWRGGGEGEDDLLVSAYRRALEVAGEIGAASIAFPGISTGIYGFPADGAARLAIATVRATPGPVERVVLVGYTGEEYERYRALLGEP